jgi:hypothetical protein
MGRRKPFVDKKTSHTYNLIFRPTEEDAQQPERVLVDAQRGIGIGRPDAAAANVSAPAAAEESAAAGGERRYPPGHPLAWLEDDSAASEAPGAVLAGAHACTVSFSSTEHAARQPWLLARTHRARQGDLG